MNAPSRKRIAAITLFILAPLVAEYLLGDLPLKLLPALIFLAPAYGGGAVLIREIARSTGRGWPTMLVLGAAYALIEEGLMTQSLFNHDYLKMHMHLLDHAYIAALGIGAWWTLFMLNLHTFWSMGVSIGIVEALFPAEAELPWLVISGDVIVAVVFVLGSAANFFIGWKQNQFLASHAQLLSAATLSVLVMAAAFLMPTRRPPTDAGAVPVPWVTGAGTSLLGMGVLFTPPEWGWGAVVSLLALDAVFLTLVTFWSRRTGWTSLHTLSLAAGGAIAYGIHAFTQRPLLGGVIAMRISNAVFLAAALWLLWVGARRVLARRPA